MSNKLILIILLIVVTYELIFSQTVVTPTLTLNASGIEDQDDMCIWIGPDASQSTIITSDKAASKLFVYDLSGNTLQTIDVPGKPGNIDIRYNFLLSGQPTDIVGYNDRDNGTIVIYKVDAVSRELTFVSNFDDGGMTGNNYGFCLYHNPGTGKYYAVASSNSTQMKQWELVDNGDGTIGGEFKRTWNNGSGDITEGLVADDETGQLYCANEGEGIYKYDADPSDTNPAGELIIPTGENDLTPDVEGIAIAYEPNDEGYLIVSSQGSDNFKVYGRNDPHTFVKTFTVEGVSNSDGIDVTSMNLGINFLQGIFITHNGSGSGPYPVMGCRFEDLDLSEVSGLPVELTSFRAILNENQVDLNWRTKTEVDNYGFNIERSTSSPENLWETIGFVEGHGNSNSPKEYNFIDNNIGNSTSLSYRLKQIDNDGSFEYSDVVTVEVVSPDNYYLSQNYPNPFNPLTKIEFTVPEKRIVSLKIFNSMGEQVCELLNEEKIAGSYSVDFDASGLASGIYVYRLQAGGFISNKKMILLK